MYDVRSGDGAHQPEIAEIAHSLEQLLPRAEKDGGERYLHLVYQTGLEVLLGNVRSPRKRHILPFGGSARLLQRGLDAIADKGEDVPVFQGERRARVVREQEDGMMERGIVAPPAVPRIVGIPGAGMAAEHVPAHD